MKVNWDEVLKSLKGEPLKEGENNLTLGTVATTAMVMPLPGDENISAKDKVEMFRVAQAANVGGIGVLKSEQVTLMKTRVAKCYSPLVVGRVCDILEPEAAAKAEAERIAEVKAVTQEAPAGEEKAGA